MILIGKNVISYTLQRVLIAVGIVSEMFDFSFFIFYFSVAKSHNVLFNHFFLNFFANLNQVHVE